MFALLLSEMDEFKGPRPIRLRMITGIRKVGRLRPGPCGVFGSSAFRHAQLSPRSLPLPSTRFVETPGFYGLGAPSRLPTPTAFLELLIRWQLRFPSSAAVPPFRRAFAFPLTLPAGSASVCLTKYPKGLYFATLKAISSVPNRSGPEATSVSGASDAGCAAPDHLRDLSWPPSAQAIHSPPFLDAMTG
jgi:hypothetical protein